MKKEIDIVMHTEIFNEKLTQALNVCNKILPISLTAFSLDPVHVHSHPCIFRKKHNHPHTGYWNQNYYLNLKLPFTCTYEVTKSVCCLVPRNKTTDYKLNRKWQDYKVSQEMTLVVMGSLWKSEKTKRKKEEILHRDSRYWKFYWTNEINLLYKKVLNWGNLQTSQWCTNHKLWNFQITSSNWDVIVIYFHFNKSPLNRNCSNQYKTKQQKAKVDKKYSLIINMAVLESWNEGKVG